MPETVHGTDEVGAPSSGTPERVTQEPTPPDSCPLPRTRVWRHGKLEAEGFPLEQVSDYLEQQGCVVWADLCHPSPAGLTTIADELSLDPHAVEDTISRHERPKLDRYPDHAFLTAYAVRITAGVRQTGTAGVRQIGTAGARQPNTADPRHMNTTGDRQIGTDTVGARQMAAEAARTGTAGSQGLQTCRISAFILRRALITVRSAHWFGPERFTDRWDASPELLEYGVPALLHAVLDEIVDGHMDAAQDLDDQIEELENLLFNDRPMPRQAQRQNFELRKNLVELRRLVLPMRDVVVSMHRWHGGPTDDPVKGIPAALEPYYQDLYDHVLRAAEATEALRDMVTTVFETNLSLQDARLNNTMRKLSAWAAIIAVPTAVTGFYGQNVPYPGFQHWSGFVASTVVMVGMAVGFFLYFRRRGWL
jgi:magnesium transporter